jgi:hypothetical protein
MKTIIPDRKVVPAGIDSCGPGVFDKVSGGEKLLEQGGARQFEKEAPPSVIESPTGMMR